MARPVDALRAIPRELHAAIRARRHPGDVTPWLQAGIDGLAARGGGTLLIPAGRYFVKGLRLKSGVALLGEEGSELMRVQGDAPPRPTHAQYFDAGANRAMIEVDWASTLAAPVADVAIRGLALRDDVAAIGFREFRHLILVGGVRGLRIERCRFDDWCGDAICLTTSAYTPGEGRTNFGVSIVDCAFTARVANQRQAISVIQAQGLRIAGCRFVGCTRAGSPDYAHPADGTRYPDFDLTDPAAGPAMPGAIDLEPDAGDTTAISRDIAITGNRFERCGGGGGAISLAFPATVAPASDVLIADNVFRDHRGGAVIAIDAARAFAADDPDMAVVITGNTAIGGNQTYRLVSCKGVKALGNSFTAHHEPGDIGWWGQRNARNVVIADRFVRCGTRPSRGALRIFNAVGITLDGTTFEDCGGTENGPVSFGDGVHPTASRDVSLRVTMTFPTNRSAAYSVRLWPRHTIVDPRSHRDAVIAPPTYTNQLRAAPPAG